MESLGQPLGGVPPGGRAPGGQPPGPKTPGGHPPSGGGKPGTRPLGPLPMAASSVQLLHSTLTSASSRFPLRPHSSTLFEIFAVTITIPSGKACLVTSKLPMQVIH